MIRRLPHGGVMLGVGSVQLDAERGEVLAESLWEEFMGPLRQVANRYPSPLTDQVIEDRQGRPAPRPVSPRRIRQEWTQFLAWAIQNPAAALEFCTRDPQLAAYVAGKVRNGDRGSDPGRVARRR